jgi:hypothetical protein
LDAKGQLFDYLELVSKSDAIRGVLIIGSPKKIGPEGYTGFYRQVLRQELDTRAFARLYNAVNQFVLKMVGFNKIVVHADCLSRSWSPSIDQTNAKGVGSM